MFASADSKADFSLIADLNWWAIKLLTMGDRAVSLDISQSSCTPVWMTIIKIYPDHTDAGSQSGPLKDGQGSNYKHSLLLTISSLINILGLCCIAALSLWRNGSKSILVRWEEVCHQLTEYLKVSGGKTFDPSNLKWPWRIAGSTVLSSFPTSTCDAWATRTGLPDNNNFIMVRYNRFEKPVWPYLLLRLDFGFAI